MRKVLSMITMIAVFAMVLTFAGCGGSGSPEDVAEKFITAFFEADAAGIMDCVPDIALEGEDRDEMEEELQDMLDMIMETIDEQSDGDWDYSIDNVEVTDDDSDELIEDIEDEFDLKKKDLESIEEAAVVEIELTLEADGEEEETSFEFLCVEIDGGWYIMNPSEMF